MALNIKDFKILIALQDVKFARSVSSMLRKHYTTKSVSTVTQFSDAVHASKLDLIIIDYKFGGMKAEDVYQGVELLHPDAIFVVYTKRDRKTLAKKLWKRRAIDYINYTDDPHHFVESVNKAVRWTIQKRDTLRLEKTINNIEHLMEDVREIVTRWKED